jgi:hypothetical protein
MMLGDERLQHLLSCCLQPAERPRLVLAHEARITDDVGGKYRGEATLHGQLPL